MIKRPYVRAADLTEQILADFKPPHPQGQRAVRLGLGRIQHARNGFRMGTLHLH